MKQRIRACRVVLNNGCVIMDYINRFGSRGLVMAGYKNHNFEGLWTCSQKEFEESIQDWVKNNKDNEHVEYVEFI